MLIVTALAPTATAGLGWNSGIAVFMTIPGGEYDIGDDVIVTVHVFSEGEYYTPDVVSLTVGVTERDIGLTEEATGRYKGVVTIADADLDQDGDLYIKAYGADRGFFWTESATEAMYMSTLAGTGFNVEVRLVEAVDMLPSPGDAVEFEVRTAYRGNPVDPDPDTLDVVYEDPTGTEHDLEVTRVATGKYEGTFTVPATLKESSGYTIWAEAAHTPRSWTMHGESSMDVEVRFFEVWAHVLEVTLSRTEVELYVLDLDGAVVEGASVKLDWAYLDDAEEEQTGSLTGTTGADGRAAFTVTYNDIGKDAYEVELEGRVTSGGLTQLYEGAVYVQEIPDIWGGFDDDTGFDVDILNEGPFEGGTSITLEQLAEYDGEPMPDTLVYFYLKDDSKIYRFGSETTDGEGKFSFPLNLPPEDPGELLQVIECHYHLEGVDSWESAYEWLYIGDIETSALLDEMLDPKVTMTVGDFSPGEPVEVTLDHPDADGEGEMAIIIWGIGEVPDWEQVLNLEWASWNPGGIGFLQIAPCQWGDGRFEASFGCPAFLTPDDEIFIYGLMVFEDEVTGAFLEGAHGAKREGVNPLPPNPPPTAAITFPVEDEKVGGRIKVKGTAGDDTGVERVEVRLDGGAWMTVEGTDTWTYELKTKPLAEGNHTLEVRSYDGEKYSDPVAVEFVVDQSVVEDDGDDSPGPVASIALLAMLAAVLVASRRRKG